MPPLVVVQFSVFILAISKSISGRSIPFLKFKDVVEPIRAKYSFRDYFEYIFPYSKMS